ncbi:MAG: DNA primase small subunit domain-containing protein, partial [Candidatus Nanopusillus sp.]
MSIMINNLIKFYQNNKEILEDMVKISQNREVGYLLSNNNFGHRPSKIETKEDIINYIKRGAISFHISIERWIDLNILSEKVSKKDLNEYRLGWDFIIDIDAKSLDLSKIAARIIFDYLKEKNINPIYIKYSGGKGFHMAIPWEIFPETINVYKKDNLVEEETRKLFPDLARILASYISKEIEEKLKKIILLKFSEDELKEYGVNDIKEFNPYDIIEIDTILISSRHLIRCLYSINEKTGNLSIPIKENYIEKLNPEDSNINNYSYEGIPYLTEDLERRESKELKKLINDSLLWKIKNEFEVIKFSKLAENYKNQKEFEETKKDLEEIKK